MIEFNFTDKVGSGLSKEIFLNRLEKAVDVLKRRITEMISTNDAILSLILVDDNEIHRINNEYRGKDTPTDVISFAYLDENKDAEVALDVPIVIGDIFISLDTAKVQAKTHKHSLEDEMTVLFVHGLLHCLGFDHNNDEEEEEMEFYAGKIEKTS